MQDGALEGRESICCLSGLLFVSGNVVVVVVDVGNSSVTIVATTVGNDREINHQNKQHDKDGDLCEQRLSCSSGCGGSSDCRHGVVVVMRVKSVQYGYSTVL